MTGITFTVHGVPQPKGSARAFVPKGWTRPVITSDNRSLRVWEDVVRGALQTVMATTDRTVLMTLFDAPVAIRCVFHLPRPKSLPARVRHHTKKPDIDKLTRGLIDALTKLAFRDDAQVVAIQSTKVYASVDAKVDVTIEPVSDFDAGVLSKTSALPLELG